MAPCQGSDRAQNTNRHCTGPCLVRETLRCLGQAAALGLARFRMYLNSRLARLSTTDRVVLSTPVCGSGGLRVRYEMRKGQDKNVDH